MKVSLKEQVKNLEGKWFYENYKERCIISSNEVKFDDCFKFVLIENEDKDIIVEETKDVYFEGEKFHLEKGEIIDGIGTYYTLTLNGENISYNNGTDYDLNNDGSNALEIIMLYIANRI